MNKRITKILFLVVAFVMAYAINVHAAVANTVYYNATDYQNANKDLKKVYNGNTTLLAQHWNAIGKAEGRSPSKYYVPDEYLKLNTDLKKVYVSSGKVDYVGLYNHFVACGIKEGRAGSKAFDPQAYINNNSDLKKAYTTNGKVNYEAAYTHYAVIGEKEGRSAVAEEKDTTAPTITLSKESISVEIGTTASALKSAIDAVITVTDNVDESVKASYDVEAVDTSKAGDYNVVITAKDSAGNKATATLKVTVADITAPEISLSKTSIELYVDATETELKDELDKVKATVTDNVDNDLTAKYDISNVDLTKTGTYTVVFTAKDKAGNEATANVTVTVKNPGIESIVVDSATQITVTFESAPKTSYTYTLVDKDGTALACNPVVNGVVATLTTGNINDSNAKAPYTLTIKDGDTTLISQSVAKATTALKNMEMKAAVSTDTLINAENVKNYKATLTTVGGVSNDVDVTITATLYKATAGAPAVQGVATDFVATTTLAANTTVTTVNFGDVSELEDGCYVIGTVVKDNFGNTTAEYVDLVGAPVVHYITKETVAPVISASAVRTSDTSATVTITSDSAIPTKYALFVEEGGSAPTAEKIKSDSTYNALGNTVVITPKAGTIYVIGEKAEGTLSNIATAAIKANTVATLTAPVITAGTASTTIAWTAGDDIATSYEVKVLLVGANTTILKTDTTTELSYDMKDVIKEYGKAGTFSVSVIAKADGYADSAEASNTGAAYYTTAAVTAPAAPTIAYNAGNKKIEVTAGAVGDANVDSLTLKVYKLTKASSYTTVNPKYDYTLIDTKTGISTAGVAVDITDIIGSDTGVFTATLTSIAKSTSVNVDSAEICGAGVDVTAVKVGNIGAVDAAYYVATPAITDLALSSATKTKLSYTFTPVSVVGVTPANVTYQAQIAAYDKIAEKYPALGNVASTGDKTKGEMSITAGVAAGTKYKVVLLASINGNKSEVSNEVEATTTTTATDPIQDNAKNETAMVVTAYNVSGDIVANTIGIINGKLYANNTDDVTKAPNYTTLYNLVSVLTAGDRIVVYKDAAEGIEIGDVKTVNVAGSASVAKSIALGTLNNATINVAGTNYTTSLTGSVKDVNVTAGKVNLEGLTISGTVAAGNNTEVTVANGTKVSIAAGSTATVNGMKLGIATAAITFTVEGTTITAVAPTTGNPDVTVDNSNVTIKTATGITLGNVIVDADAEGYTVDLSGANCGAVSSTGLKDVTIKLPTGKAIGIMTTAGEASVVLNNNNLVSVTGVATITDASTIAVSLPEISAVSPAAISSSVIYHDNKIFTPSGATGTYTVSNIDTLTINLTSGTITFGAQANNRVVTNPSEFVKFKVTQPFTVNGDNVKVYEKTDYTANGSSAAVVPSTLSNAGVLTVTTPGTTKDYVIVWSDALTEVVKFTNMAAQSVTINEAAATLDVAATTTYTAKVNGDASGNATNQNVAWTSSVPAVAAVNASGVVTAVAPGTTTITATSEDGNLTDTKTVTVSGVVISQAGNLTAIDVDNGTLALTANVYGNATAGAWTSSSDAIATVDGTGTVTAVADGTVTITYTDGTGNYTATYVIEISNQA